MKKKKKSKNLLSVILICVFTFINFFLAIMVRIYDRKQIVKAIQTDEGVKTLLVSKKETKIL